MSVPEPGHIVAGKYEVERVIGAGGMGTVVSAIHVHLRERVAIKLLSPEAAEQTESVSRFMREARAAARIRSEHVAKVSDVGTLTDGTPYIVMEYLEGYDLADTLAQRGPFPVDEALELVLQACEAVAEAHSLGIVHRDLKPANLFLTRRADGTPAIKVLDFGISKVTQPGNAAVEAALTHTTTVMGSPLYMSPEQIRASRNVDLRTDIWAFGVILYELLSGEAPFSGQTLPDISVKIAVEPPPPLRVRRPDLPPLLEAIILKCLAKDREQRFRTLGELAVALYEIAPVRARVSIDRVVGVIQSAGLPDSVLPSGVAPSANRVITGSGSVDTGARTAETFSTFGRTASGGKKRRTLLLVAAVSAVLGIALGVALLLRPPPPADPGASSAAVVASPESAGVVAPLPLPQPMAVPVVTPAAPVPTLEAPEPAAAPSPPVSQGPRPRAPKAPPHAPSAEPTPAAAPNPPSPPSGPGAQLDSRK